MTAPVSPPVIARLKVTLDSVEPLVLRRLEVPFALRLDRLHETLQAALGWTGTHLYEIRARGIGWGLPDPDWGDGPLDARKATLASVVEDTGARTLDYLYDFGDGWELAIRIEGLAAPQDGVLYPRLLEAKGRCPPEDVGGPPGYAEFLLALSDPEDEQHAETLEWIGEDFDPHVVDIETLTASLQRLARKWSRKPPSRKPKAT